MKTLKTTVESVGLKIGLMTALALVAYFFVMKALGLSHVIELRIFNFFILAAGVCYGIHKLKTELNEKDFYLKGLAEGILITIVTMIPFAAFVSYYLIYFDLPLLQHIKDNAPMGMYMNGFTLFFVVGMEGVASGAIITFCAMQYFKSAEKRIARKKKVNLVN